MGELIGVNRAVDEGIQGGFNIVGDFNAFHEVGTIFGSGMSVRKQHIKCHGTSDKSGNVYLPPKDTEALIIRPMGMADNEKVEVYSVEVAQLDKGGEIGEHVLILVLATVKI